MLRNLLVKISNGNGTHTHNKISQISKLVGLTKNANCLTGDHNAIGFGYSVCIQRLKSKL
jgi:hypothetical protein